MTDVPTRGERNNNPGNIVFVPTITWVGQLGLEADGPPGEAPRFIRFDCPENGIRAIAKILEAYHREGFDTIRKMIDRWAPPTENDTAAYIEDVAATLGDDPDAPSLLDDLALETLVEAIIHHENGRCIYAGAAVTEGVRRALPP